MTGRRSKFVARWFGWGMLALMAAWTPAAEAQLDGFRDLTGLGVGGRTPKPEFTTTLTPETAKAGDEVTLAIHVKLPAGCYITNAGESDGQTKIKLKEVGLEPLDAGFIPDRAPKIVRLPDLDMELSKFYDHVTWKKRYRIAKDADLSKVSIAGELSGQYCTDGGNGEGGKCVPIIPAYGFEVALPAPPRFEYEERPVRGKTNPALLRFKLSPEDAKPGDKVTLSIDLQLDEGWHTFSLTQKGEGGDPTVIELDSVHGLKPLGKDFVPDHPAEVEVEKELGLTLEVHHGRVTWSREFEVLPEAQSGQIGVSGRISYQTCKTSCIPSREVSFVLGVVPPVRQGGNEDPQVADVAPPADEKPEHPAPAGIPLAKRPQDRGLFGFILTAVGFGFLSLLTPCVWPMIPITVSFFLKQSESEHHRPLNVALVFCGSIIATFTILGVGIAAIFGAAKLNALANSPWLNVVIGTVFVVFALNMLGLFEIRIPSGLLTFTANKEQAGGYLGAMFMALTFTLTSFTCTFAFAGSLLIAASQGQYYWPIIGMLAFGAAFASPFFLLAMVPSMMKKLPKSGGWMNSVKVVMGLIEIGAAVKFFSVADLVWNPEPVIFDFVFVMISWLVLSLMIALYLLGVFRLAHDVPAAGISVGRMLLVMAFFGLSFNLAVGLITHEKGGGWFMDQVIAFAPPRFENEAAMEKGAAPPTDLPSPVLAHHGIWFTLDVDKAIVHATKQQRPMLYDFTGVNCVNCRLMEKKMPQPHNRGRLEKFVLVQLYADKVPTISDAAEVKRLLKRNVDLQTEWFGDVSLPSYAVVSPDGKKILSMYTGLEQKEGEFAEFLDEGWKNWEAMQQQVTAELPKPVFEDHGIKFMLDVDKGIEHARQIQRPLFCSFAGVNDVQSRLALKKMVIPVAERIKDFVPVEMYIDKVPTISNQAHLKRLLKRNVDLHTEWFGDLATPSYAVVSPDGKTILSMYTGLEQKEGEFAEFLDEGWKNWEAMQQAPAVVVVDATAR